MRKSIPEDIKIQANNIVKEFNERVIHDPKYFYVTRYKGDYLYLDRYDGERFGPVCRLKYTGNIENWEFTILLYRYHDAGFVPGQWISPGEGFVDGTIESAMKAGLKMTPLKPD